MKKNFLDNLITLTNVEVTFTSEQWKTYKQGRVTLSEVHKMNLVDKEIGKLNRTAYNLLIFMVAGVIGAIEIYKNTLTVPVSNPVGAIDVLGNTFLNIFQGLGRWVTLIMAFIEIVKSIMKGSTSTSEIFGIIFKYVIVFATMFLLPYFFDVVASAF
jgi:hypothetical protein